MSLPNVLIIDDDITICDEVASGLERHHFAARATTQPAGDFLNDGFYPDVIVLDLDMPGVDGFQVIERLGRATCKPQLIVASGHHSRIINAAARSAGAAGIVMLGELEKPYSVGALVALLEKYPAAPEAVVQDEAQRIRRMIEDNSVYRRSRVAFQSKRALKTSDVVGYEALLRVSDGQPINPEMMFKPAVRFDVQLGLTAMVLDEAMAFARMLADGGRPLPIAVNCTPAILCADSFIDLIVSTLARHDVPSHNLLLEITEHNSLSSLDEVAAVAGRLALRQIGVVVDDFGRGTTSFEKLLDLPLSELKVDKSIFWMAVTGEIAPNLLKEVIGLCAGRGIATTVEGVETKAHRDLARQLGADYGQGYFWDRPRSAPEILMD